MPIMPRDKVLDKIRKLIALSGSANVHEAAVAAAAAQRLMLEHRIAETEISIETSDDDVVMDQEIYRDLRLKAPPRWHGILLNGVATANFCKLVLDTERAASSDGTERRKIYRIIGTEHDRAAVRTLYELLRGEVERLCDAAARAQRYDRADRASFKLGAASALAGRLTREAGAFRSDLQAAAHTQALAVIDRTSDALERFVSAHFPRLTQRRSPSVSRASAYLHGREAGGRIDVGAGHRRLDAGRRGLPEASS